VGGCAPRAPGDSVRPRRLSGASVRPLNFTVRRPRLRWWTGFASVVFIPIACSADMDELPDNDAAFQQRVDALVKPGDRSPDAVALLTKLHFTCKPLSDTQTWCSRSDLRALIAHRYQIVLTVHEGRVVATRATTGLVGP
jgi:hypothetical protein